MKLRGLLSAAGPTTGMIALVLFGIAKATVHPLEGLSGNKVAIQFESTQLHPADNGKPFRSIREVHPKLERISAWISSVGAAVAIADIAGSGRPADLCLVDPRNDSVTVMPAPGTGQRYRPFALSIPTDGYDARTIAPMGCVPADMNEDGRMDLLVYFWGRTPVAYLQKEESQFGASSFVAVEIVASRERWFTNAALFADVDGDGHADLLIGNYFQDGDRILDPAATMGGEMQHSMSRAENAGRNRLFLWKDSGSISVLYDDASRALSDEMANGWTLAMAAADLDGDLLPEIYIANDFGSDRLLHNRSEPGRPKFVLVEGERGIATPRSKVLGRDSFKGMGVDFGNVGANGHLAIAVSNIAQPYALLESHFLFMHSGDDGAWKRGVAPYRDESGPRGTSISGWAWDIKFADLENSGSPALLQAIGFVKGERNRWPELQELAMGNDELLKNPGAWPRFGPGDGLSGDDHDRIFRQDRAGTFRDISRELGLPSGTVSRGIATADVYGDGQLAVAIARQWMPSVFLRNVSPDAGRSVVLDLRLAGKLGGDRAAIGASARLLLPDQRLLTDRVDGGSGHSGRRAPEIHFGVGQISASQKLPLELSWRDEKGLHIETMHVSPGRHRLILIPGMSLARGDGRTPESTEITDVARK